jgi:hypothetical protein
MQIVIASRTTWPFANSRYENETNMQTRQIHNLARSNKMPLLSTLVNLQPPYERHGDTIYRLSIRGPEHATTNMLDEAFRSMV